MGTAGRRADVKLIDNVPMSTVNEGEPLEYIWTTSLVARKMQANILAPG